MNKLEAIKTDLKLIAGKHEGRVELGKERFQKFLGDLLFQYGVIEIATASEMQCFQIDGDLIALAEFLRGFDTEPYATVLRQLETVREQISHRQASFQQVLSKPFTPSVPPRGRRR